MLVLKCLPKFRSAVLVHLLVGLVLAGCNSPDKKPARGVTTQKDSSGDQIKTREVSQGPNQPEWSRAEWLKAAEGFLQHPKTMPRLDESKSRPQFQKLITTKAWLDLEWRIFEGDPSELLRFFPTIKRLVATLLSLGAVDEIVALGLYNLDVYKAFLSAGMEFIDQLPAQDSSRRARLGGLDTIRLGAAIGVAGLLYSVLDASEETRNAAFGQLTLPIAYSFHSREGLQLLLATLDEKLIKSGPPQFRQQYEKIRTVVAAEHAKRTVTPSTSQVTYQGIGPAGLNVTNLQTVVSTTGKFSVDLGPGGLAKRVEVSNPDGTTSVQHWIELQYGDSKFESVCIDDQSEASLAATLMKMGVLVAEKSEHNGQWFTLNKPGRDGRMRILSIAGRACMASVEGPLGQLPTPQVQAFLLSLQAAP